jgi:hypothetical protein
MVAMIAYETWGSSLGITICAKITNITPTATSARADRDPPMLSLYIVSPRQHTYGKGPSADPARSAVGSMQILQ